MEQLGNVFFVLLVVGSIFGLIGLVGSSFESAPYRTNKLFFASVIIWAWMIAGGVYAYNHPPTQTFHPYVIMQCPESH